MTLPCTTCKYKTEHKNGHRIFVGCRDSEKKKSLEELFENYYRCSEYKKEED